MASSSGYSQGRGAREVNDRAGPAGPLSGLLINLLGNATPPMQPDRSYLVCATPRSGSTLVCHALERNRRRRAPRGVLRGAAPQRPPAPPRGILRRRRRPLDPRPPRRARGRQRAAAPLAAVEPRRLRPLPGVGLRGRDHAQRRLRREADVGLLRRLRQPAAQRPRLPRRPARRAAADRLPRPHLRPRRPRQQGAPGGLALEGGADRDLARGPGQRQGGLARGRRLPSLPQLHRGAPPAAALPLPGDRAPARAAPDRGVALGRLLRALRDQTGAGPLRELRRRLRDQHPATCSTASTSPRPTTSSSSRG